MAVSASVVTARTKSVTKKITLFLAESMLRVLG
jgi:hypothetical protein